MLNMNPRGSTASRHRFLQLLAMGISPLKRSRGAARAPQSGAGPFFVSIPPLASGMVSRIFMSLSMVAAFCTTTTAMGHLPTSQKKPESRPRAGHRALSGLTMTTMAGWIFSYVGSSISLKRRTNSAEMQKLASAITAFQACTIQRPVGYFTTMKPARSPTWHQTSTRLPTI